MKLVICGLSITSSWENAHAALYRALVRGLTARGHDVLFLERDIPWHAAHRDLPVPPFGRTRLYGSLEELDELYRAEVAEAELTIVGSCVPQGTAVGRWAIEHAGGAAAFYDLDTPLTLTRVRGGKCDYLSGELIPRYDLYLSATGGGVLRRLESTFGSPMARALYGGADAAACRPVDVPQQWDLGHLGGYRPDRQLGLDRLLLEPARLWPQGRFIVVGRQYPPQVRWPANVRRLEELGDDGPAAFFSAQRMTLNLTRADLARAGWCPSLRMFQAAACGTPILSDWWQGLDNFFRIGQEILVARTAREALELVRHCGPAMRERIGGLARRRVLAEHTAEHRAMQLEGHVHDALARRRPAVA